MSVDIRLPHLESVRLSDYNGYINKNVVYCFHCFWGGFHNLINYRIRQLLD